MGDISTWETNKCKCVSVYCLLVYVSVFVYNKHSSVVEECRL